MKFRGKMIWMKNEPDKKVIFCQDFFRYAQYLRAYSAFSAGGKVRSKIKNNNRNTYFVFWFYVSLFFSFLVYDFIIHVFISILHFFLKV